MSQYTLQELNKINVIKSLYTDVFDSGNCAIINNYYHDDAICHLNGKKLNLEEMKKGMGEFVAKHESISTTIESIIARGDRTYARLRRDAKIAGDKAPRSIQIMVEKRFEDDKVKELWFMVDDDAYSNIWLSKIGG
jgi:predicted SnoaL-like aldol condensation-catalyzing enzyme